MQYKLTLVLAAAILFFSSCNNSSTSGKSGHSDSTLAEEVEVPDYISTSFPELFNFLRVQDQSFSPEAFEEIISVVQDDSSDRVQDISQLKSYSPYLLFNSDSSMALDLITYNYIQNIRSGNTTMEEAGPDYEAALINFKTGKRKQLLFFGTTGTVFDAKWVGDSAIVLAGSTDYEGKDSMLPVIWKYEPASKKWTEYQYPKMLHADWTAYKSPRYVRP